MKPWKPETFQIDAALQADIRASAEGVVLGQHNHVWFHDLHLTEWQALSIGLSLIRAAFHSLQAQLELKA